MILRAFVLGVTPRGVLAVAAIAISIAYALVSSGAVSGLRGTGAALESAQTNAGFVYHDAGLAPFSASAAPAGSTLVAEQVINGTRVATLKPWSHSNTSAFKGPYARESDLLHPWTAGLNVSNRRIDFAPPDGLTIPPELFDQVTGGGTSQVRWAYRAGAADPSTTLRSAPWQGVAEFYEGGARQIQGGMVVIVAATGVLVSLLASGLVRLEVLARLGDFATLEALAGRSTVRRLIAARTLTLVGSGVLAGLALAFGAIQAVNATLGGPSLFIPASVAWSTALAAGGGGTAFGMLAGWETLRRSTAARLTHGGIPVRRFRGPYRFLLVTPRLFLGVFAATLVTACILGVVLSTSAIPYQLFATTEEDILITEGGKNPLRGHADRLLGENARFLPGVLAANPQTFAPTTINGRPVMVKGVDFTSWRDYSDADLVAGAWPAKDAEATVGQRLARSAAIGIGEFLLVPSSYHRGVEVLKVVGMHDLPGLERDELLVDLSTAGRLAGLDRDQVTLIRLRLESASVRVADLLPASGINVIEVKTDPPAPVPWTPAFVNIRVANFDPTTASRALSVRLNGNTTASLTVTLEGRSTDIVRIPIVVPAGGQFRLEVNPTADVETRPATLQVTLPAVARPAEAFPVRVATNDGNPVEGARILVDGDLAGTTDMEGDATITIPDLRLAVVSAVTPTDSGGGSLRVAPASFDATPLLIVERLTVQGTESLNATHFRARAEATVANVGGRAFAENVTWQLDGAPAAASFVDASSATRRTIGATLEAPFGDHLLTVLDGETRLAVAAPSPEATDDPTPTTSAEPPGGDAPHEAPRARTIADVIAEKRNVAASRPSGAADQVDAFLGQVFGTLQTANRLVVASTFAFAGMLVWVSVVREVRERRSILDLLRALGASQRAVNARVLRDTSVSILVPILAALLAAMLLLGAGRFYGFPAAFGHTLPTDEAKDVILRAGVGIAGIAVAAAFYAGRTSRTPGPAFAPEWDLRQWVASRFRPGMQMARAASGFELVDNLAASLAPVLVLGMLAGQSIALVPAAGLVMLVTGLLTWFKTESLPGAFLAAALSASILRTPEVAWAAAALSALGLVAHAARQPWVYALGVLGAAFPGDPARAVSALSLGLLAASTRNEKAKAEYAWMAPAAATLLTAVLVYLRGDWWAVAGVSVGLVARFLAQHPANARVGRVFATGAYWALPGPAVLLTFLMIVKQGQAWSPGILLPAAWGVLALGVVLFLAALGLEVAFRSRGPERAFGTVALLAPFMIATLVGVLGRIQPAFDAFGVGMALLALPTSVGALRVAAAFPARHRWVAFAVGALTFATLLALRQLF